MFMFTRLATLAGLLSLCIAVIPSHAASPLDKDGALYPADLDWVTAKAGENPMTADETAAVIAFLGICTGLGHLKKENIKLGALKADLEAGGNDWNDFFSQGGKYNQRTEEFGKKFQTDNGGAYWAVACGMNPYVTK